MSSKVPEEGKSVPIEGKFVPFKRKIEGKSVPFQGNYVPIEGKNVPNQARKASKIKAFGQSISKNINNKKYISFLRYLQCCAILYIFREMGQRFLPDVPFNSFTPGCIIYLRLAQKGARYGEEGTGRGQEYVCCNGE